MSFFAGANSSLLCNHPCVGQRHDHQIHEKSAYPPFFSMCVCLPASAPPPTESEIRLYSMQDHVIVDQIGKDRNQTATGVTHMAISCGWQQRPAVLADLVRCYGGCVFALSPSQLHRENPAVERSFTNLNPASDPINPGLTKTPRFRGRSIVFTDTKAEANELALSSSLQSGPYPDPSGSVSTSHFFLKREIEF